MQEDPQPHHAERVLVDLDGVITVGPGRGPYDFAPVRQGARKFLESLRDLGFDEVVIFTARNTDAAKNFLRQQGLLGAVNDVTSTKLPAKVYIDDRAIQFRGDYQETLGLIEEFRPHWDEEPAEEEKEEKREEEEHPTVGRKRPAGVRIRAPLPVSFDQRPKITAK